MTDAPRARPRILVVDDNPIIVTLLECGLANEGYDVAVARTGREALAEVDRAYPDLVLLDIELPELPGDEVCRLIKADPRTRLIPVVMITGAGTSSSKVDAWNNGADEFLPKPFQLVEVMARCRSLLRIRALAEERDSAESVVYALARAVEAKSAYTHGHSERVMGLCLRLAEVIGLGADEREVLRKGALLHDVGKIRVPDAVLNKPGKLSDAEFAVVKEHPVAGAHIVEPLASVRPALPLILHHHERLDGKGYPHGLSAADLSPSVRVLSVCDVFDSLVSDRPYRGPVPYEACIAIMRQNAAGGGLDAELVELFAEDVAARRTRETGVSADVPHAGPTDLPEANRSSALRIDTGVTRQGP